MKNVFSFPQRSVSDQLLYVFLESVFPLFPIFDRRELLLWHERLYSHQESYPLLFHSLYFSACQFADERLIRDAGFSSVVEARIYFFRRAKALYSADCEPDHVIVVQSLILLSFWWMDYTEEKDMRYWVTCAVNLALTMGMHKKLPKSLNLSNARRKLWRRLFWTLYVSAPSSFLDLPTNTLLEPRTSSRDRSGSAVSFVSQRLRLGNAIRIRFSGRV
jgi:hypothetical protein